MANQTEKVTRPNRRRFSNTGRSKMADEFSCWALVEVMGHRKFAGKVSEQVIAGCGFIRIDIPAVEDRQAFTKLIGTGSIYAVTPVSEAVAHDLARQFRERAVEVYAPDVQKFLPTSFDDDWDGEE